jgi:hypothetical protein
VFQLYSKHPAPPARSALEGAKLAVWLLLALMLVIGSSACGESASSPPDTGIEDGGGLDGVGLDGAGSDGVGLDGIRADGVGSDSAGSDGAGSDGAGSDGAGSDGAGSDGVGLRDSASLPDGAGPIDAGPRCPVQQLLCAGLCIDPSTSNGHCGASGDCAGANVGVVCKAGERCTSGACVLSCQQGLIDCAGTCVDPDTSVAYCGATGDCSGANAGQTCPLTTACVAGSCKKLFLAWGAAQLIETDNAGGATNAQVAVDTSGNATVVWRQSDGTRDNIWANRYSAPTGSWGKAQLLETDNAGYATDPQVAVDASGNATAVWYQYDGMRNNIWSNRYSATTGTWGTAQLIETENLGHAFAPQVAMDASGNATAVWFQSDGPRNNIWSNRYSATTGSWGKALLIENATGNGGTVQVGVDASGNATAVWQQHDGSRYNIWSNRYNATTTSWGQAVLIETNNAGNATGPQVAVNASGDATAVWKQHDGSRHNIWSNRYSAKTGTWATAQLIETNNSGHAYDAQVAMDAGGNATAVWYQSDGTRNNIWSNRYSATTGTWGVAQLIETASGDTRAPQVAVDASGNATAVWDQHDGSRYNIWSNRYSAVTGSWGQAELLETDDAGHARAAQVAVDASGNATAVWHQSDGTRSNIRSSRYE